MIRALYDLDQCRSRISSFDGEHSLAERNTLRRFHSGQKTRAETVVIESAVTLQFKMLMHRHVLVNP